MWELCQAKYTLILELLSICCFILQISDLTKNVLFVFCQATLSFGSRPAK